MTDKDKNKIHLEAPDIIPDFDPIFGTVRIITLTSLVTMSNAQAVPCPPPWQMIDTCGSW